MVLQDPASASDMMLAVTVLLAVLSLAMLVLMLRARRAAAARRAEAESATALAGAVASLATATTFTLNVERDGRYATGTVLGALHAWLGYQDDETTPREAWRLLVHPDDRSVVEQALRQALAGERVQCDVRYVPAAGGSRRLRLGLRPERDRWGWVHAVHGILREPPERPELEADLEATHRRVDELAAQEEALRVDEERVRLAVEGAGMATWDADLATGEMTLSPALAATVGMALPPDGRIRMDEWMGQVHPDDQPAMRAAVEAAQRNGTRFALTYRVVRADDRRLVWLATTGRVMRREAGAPGRWIGVSFDVTERVQLDERVRLRSEELSSTAALLDGVLGNAPLPIIYMDREFRLVRINAAAAERFGQELGALIGRPAAQVAPDAWRRVEGICRAVLERGLPIVDAEVTMHGPFGDRPEARTYLASLFPVRGVDGTVIGIGAFATDITERKRLEEALRAGELYLRDLADAMPQIVYILDADLRCEFVNRGFADFTGLSTHAPDALQASVHPDDWTGVRPRVLEAMAAGKGHADEARLRESASGHYRWFLMRTVPQRDANGRVTRWFGTATDIHEQKRIQRALQYAEARQRALADAAVRVTASLSLTRPLPDTLQLVTELGREVVGANAALLTALPDADGGFGLRIEACAEGTGEEAGLDLALAERLQVEVERTGATVRLDRAELARGNPTPGPIPNGAMAVPIAGRDGRPLGVLRFADRFDGEFGAEDEAVAVQMASMAAVALENSDLVQRIREEDQRKDEFLATLAHELRNPLAPIANSLELLRYADQDGRLLQHARGTMERQMGQMVHLIDDLLDASRISRGKLALRRELVVLQTVILHALEAARPALDRTVQAVELDLPETPVWLDADPTRLTQIFTNLLDNAAKYSEPGGCVTVTAVPHADTVTVHVTDTGLGIPADKLATIFEMFSQVDQSIEKSAGGLGIGLALVRGLVEMHGGRIEAASGGVGKGTEMRVTLPRSAEGPAPTARALSPEAPLRPRRILVADDNQDSADSLVTLLRLAGHEAHAVYDGASAVEAAARLGPDIVLLDLGMPRVSGHEAALRIREGPARGVALVALTGWGDERTRQRTREEGFDAHLTKPVDFQHLLEVLAGI